MLKESSVKLVGNDRFEGFGIDLIKELGSMLGFNYTFKLHPNSVYGGFDKKTKQWTGMIRELMERVSHFLIIHAFHISYFIEILERRFSNY